MECATKKGMTESCFIIHKDDIKIIRSEGAFIYEIKIKRKYGDRKLEILKFNSK